MSMFKKATKAQLKLRMATAAPSGAGKTYTSLVLATHLAPNGKVAVIDSERGKSQLYADAFNFDVLDLAGDYDPRTYTKAVKEAANEGYEVIIIDSLSHAWDGALTMKDSVAKRSRTGDSFGAWREVTPVFNDLIDTILSSPAHVLCTLRQKTEYEISKDDRGKNRVDKIGLAPQFRSGVEYEFDIVADMDLENNWIVTKTRYSALHGKVINRPGKDLVEELKNWLENGEPVAQPHVIEQLRERLNLLTGEARTSFKAEFGMPAALVQSRVSDALTFVSALEAKAKSTTDIQEVPSSDDQSPQEAQTPPRGRGMSTSINILAKERGIDHHPVVEAVTEGRTRSSKDLLDTREANEVQKAIVALTSQPPTLWLSQGSDGVAVLLDYDPESSEAPEAESEADADDSTDEVDDAESWSAEKWREVIKGKGLKLVPVIQKAQQLKPGVGSLEMIAGSGIAGPLRQWVEAKAQ